MPKAQQELIAFTPRRLQFPLCEMRNAALKSELRIQYVLNF